MSRLRTIELFAGAGGLADGFEQTGKYDLLASVEWKIPQVRTLKKRMLTKYKMLDADDRILHFDIQRTEELLNGWSKDAEFASSEGLYSLVGDNKVDLISGGPPCQAYSLAGRVRDVNGMKDDYRNFLFEAYIRVVKEFMPKVIVFENVEGILSAIPTGEKITELIRKAFNDIGYEIIDDLRQFALIDLSKYGVPQRRKRVIIIGIRKDSDIDYQEILKDFYVDILANHQEETKTVKDAIADLPPIYPLEVQSRRNAYDNNSGINGHVARYHSQRDQEIFSILAQDIESGREEYASIEALKSLYYKYTGKQSNIHKYHVLRWNMPSNTIPAHLKKDGLRHIHPDPLQKRTITVREAARIQTFDDDFMFEESQSDNYEMIGNAVPPVFSKKLALSVPILLDILKKAESR